MKKGLIWVGLLILLTLLAVPSLAGCGGAASKETMEIRIGVMGGQTGQASAAVAPIMEEMEYMFRYVNEVEGGIDGAKLNWRIVDNKGTPDGAIIAYKELRDGFDPLIYISVEDYVLIGIKDMIAEDKAIVFTYSALDPTLYAPPGSFFSVGIPMADGFAAFSRWLLSDWKGSGAPNLGVLHWERASGLMWKTAEGWVKEQGVELVPVSYPMTAMDFKPQFLQLRDARVDYIWFLGISPQAALAIRDYRGLGMQIPMYFNEYVEGKVLLDLMGPGAEGFVYYRAESPHSDGTQAAKLYTEIWKWAKGEDRWNDNRINLSIKASIEAAVKQAVADVGWNNLDNEAIYNALNKLNRIDTWGNMESFGFGPDRRVGVSTIKLERFTKDGIVSASDWIQLPRIFEGIDK